MDVINPELENIDGIMYRINETDCFYYGSNVQTLPYIEYDDDEIECAREIVDDDFEKADSVNLEVLDNGKYRCHFHVPRIFNSVIVGHKGGTLQRLQNETKTTILIPEKGDIGDVVVIGLRRDRILMAYRRIQSIIATARFKQPFTHFISIPMNNNEFLEKYKYFMDNVLEICGNDRGVHKDLFKTPIKLHLTIGMLKLLDDIERKSAVDALEECKTSVINPILDKRSIIVHICGLEYMNDDPSEVSILYGKILENEMGNTMQLLVDEIYRFFIKKALMEERRGRDNVKLHITLMKTKNLDSDITTNQCKKRSTFNASNILEFFQDFDFGKVEVKSIHLSQRFTTAANGYFASSHQIKLEFS